MAPGAVIASYILCASLINFVRDIIILPHEFLGTARLSILHSLPVKSQTFDIFCPFPLKYDERFLGNVRPVTPLSLCAARIPPCLGNATFFARASEQQKCQVFSRLIGMHSQEFESLLAKLRLQMAKMVAKQLGV